MESTYGNYQNCLTAFYKKILRSHSKKLTLFERFTKTRDSYCKMDEKKQDLIFNRSKSKDLDDSKSVSGTSNRSLSKSYKSVKNIELKSFHTQYIFLTSTFSTAFIFSYIYYLLGTQNEQAFNKVINQTSLIFDYNKKNAINQKQLQYWKKIKQLYPNKKKVRWEKLLGDCLSHLSSSTKSQILKGICSTNSNINKHLNNRNNFSELHPTNQNLKVIAHFFKLTINYFECEEGEITKASSFIGSGKNSLWIGKMISDERYACFDKQPGGYKDFSPKQKLEYSQQQEKKTITRVLSSKTIPEDLGLDIKKSLRSTQDIRKDLNSSDCKSERSESSRLSTKSGLVKRKVLRNIESLMHEYHKNTQKFYGLQILKQSNAKQEHIKKVISSRRIIHS